jgi:hypothetical protein
MKEDVNIDIKMSSERTGSLYQHQKAKGSSEPSNASELKGKRQKIQNM